MQDVGFKILPGLNKGVMDLSLISCKTDGALTDFCGICALNAVWARFWCRINHGALPLLGAGISSNEFGMVLLIQAALRLQDAQLTFGGNRSRIHPVEGWHGG